MLLRLRMDHNGFHGDIANANAVGSPHAAAKTAFDDEAKLAIEMQGAGIAGTHEQFNL